MNPSTTTFSVLEPTGRDPTRGILCASVEDATHIILRERAGRRLSIWALSPGQDWFKVTLVVRTRRGVRFQAVADAPILDDAPEQPPPPLRTWGGGQVERMPGADTFAVRRWPP